MREISIVLVIHLSLASSLSPPIATNNLLVECISLFYSASYKEDCSKNLDFLSTDLSAQRKAFTSGKSCVLKITKSKCTSSDYQYLSANYDKIVNDITTKPKDESNCYLPFYMYNMFKCASMMESVADQTSMLSTIKTINDTRMIKAIDQCNDVKVCMAPSCYAFESERQIVATACESIEMQNTGFMFCLKKIGREKPDLSNYKCIGNYDFSMTTSEMFTTNKWCTKWIMRKICGNRAVTNFQKYAAITVKALELSDD